MVILWGIFGACSVSEVEFRRVFADVDVSGLSVYFDNFVRVSSVMDEDIGEVILSVSLFDEDGESRREVSEDAFL